MFFRFIYGEKFVSSWSTRKIRISIIIVKILIFLEELVFIYV